MPIDAYSSCPCGTGKKIKFCCPDLLGDLQKIDRMLEGEQYLGCLQHIDRLRERHPDRACLYALKGMLLRGADQWEEAAANADAFVQKHPDNTVALAESTIVTAVRQGGRAAVATLHRALAASDGKIQGRVYEAMGTAAEALLSEGEWLAGRALLQLQMAIAKEDRRPVDMLVQFNRSAGIPLLCKDDPPMATCPDDAPWKTRFEEAMAPTQVGNWPAAAERLAALAVEVDDAPAIWQNLATLRGWLADGPACIEALQKLATLDVPQEDAVEAEALAMLLSDDPLGDRTDMLALLWEIRDVEHFQAALALDSRAVQIPFDPAALSSRDTPPPKAAYLLLDRPIPETAENVTLQTVCRFLGQAMLYGRQTDRQARLEVTGVASGDLEPIKALLREVAGDALESDVEDRVMARVSASREMLQPKWRTANDVTREQLQELVAQHQRDALLHRWPQGKLGIFDGRSPREVADDPAYRVKLQAAVLVLALWFERVVADFDFNLLRSQLGLPTLEPIDPQEASVQRLPLIRLSRLVAEKLSDEDLLLGYRRAVAFGATEATLKFARIVIDRPSLAGQEESFRAYLDLARTEDDPDRALAYVEQGRQAAESAGQSSANWDLWELSFRYARGQSGEATRLVQHIQKEHFEEPGVAEALMDFLVRVGVLRPDGTPATPPPEEASVIVSPDQPSPEPGKIWTPGSQQQGGRGKIWTPD